MRKSVDYDTYFDSMQLSKEQKKKRKEFARRFERAVFFLFALIQTMRDANRMINDYLLSQFVEQYKDVAKDFVDIDDYMEDYIEQYCREVIDITLDNPDDEYYLSDDRAVSLSENEANASLNYKEYTDAIKSGKTKKRWITEKDDKVRETHKMVDNKDIRIDRPFVVGDSLLQFPKDTSLGASMEEIANCRCTIEYF
jgi:hypothetical protein